METIAAKPHGYRMPAEWATHAATWMSWPFDDEMWHGKLAQVRKEYEQLVRTICRFEPVHLLVRDDEAEKSAKEALKQVDGHALHFHRVPLDDVWLRDNGPLFILPGASAKKGPAIAAVNWRFNSWGQKYSWDLDDQAPLPITKYLQIPRIDVDVVMEGGSLELNGTGACLTTEQCLLSPNRNPNMDKAELAQVLQEYLGIEKLIWLKNGLEGDHTDGHIDTITRFVGEHTILTSVCRDERDANFQTMQENLRILHESRDLNGEAFTIVELPLPKERMELADGTRLPATYANFYICNGAVIVPQYGDPMDEPALELIRSVFPQHEVIGLASRYIITGGGSFHCLTQQQPQS
ncbi:MAG: agmatine deiminase family protein [Oligoflexus sp.]